MYTRFKLFDPCEPQMALDLNLKHWGSYTQCGTFTFYISNLFKDPVVETYSVYKISYLIPKGLYLKHVMCKICLS